jgi:hypothetical protein
VAGVNCAFERGQFDVAITVVSEPATLAKGAAGFALLALTLTGQRQIQIRRWRAFILSPSPINRSVQWSIPSEAKSQ